MERKEIRQALTEEYERRIGIPIEEHEDVDKWVEDIYSSDWSIEQVVDYIIEKYDLVDLEPIFNNLKK